MKGHHIILICCALLILCAVPSGARAQGSMAAAQPYLKKARAAAWQPGDGLNNLTYLYETVCKPAMDPKGPQPPPDVPPVTRSERKIPPRYDWYYPPAKVFDNLYWLGTWGTNTRQIPHIGGDSTWAVTTSKGIILIDSGEDYTAPVQITEGLKKLGLDPTQIKYVVLSHAHGDRYQGSSYLQNTYHVHVMMSAADWGVLAKSDEPSWAKPKRDKNSMVITDGEKFTLGDTTLRFYITPGHTPGTVSTLVPIKDGTQRHLGVVWGGIAPSLIRYRVQYFPNWAASFKTWATSAYRFQKIADAAGADVYLTIHPHYDEALEKIHLASHYGDRSAMVSKSNVDRFLTIMRDCTLAQWARIQPIPKGVPAFQP
jgi:metallo-beta-lactamase class B